MTSSAMKVYHNQVKDVFGEVADRLARQTGFVRRQSPLTGSLFVQVLVPTSTVAVVSRVRGQVELAFKVAKTEAALERSPREKPQRVMGEL